MTSGPMPMQSYPRSDDQASNTLGGHDGRRPSVTAPGQNASPSMIGQVKVFWRRQVQVEVPLSESRDHLGSDMYHKKICWIDFTNRSSTGTHISQLPADLLDSLHDLRHGGPALSSTTLCPSRCYFRVLCIGQAFVRLLHGRRDPCRSAGRLSLLASAERHVTTQGARWRMGGGRDWRYHRHGQYDGYHKMIQHSTAY